MSARMAVGSCRRRLAGTWLTLTVVGLIVLVVQDMNGVYGSREGETWEWFFPAVVPVASLMISTLVSSAMTPEPTETVSAFVYRLALALSVIYLVLVIAMPLSNSSAVERLENMNTSDRFLTPLHGIVGLALGAFFASQKDSGSKVPDTSKASDTPKT